MDEVTWEYAGWERDWEGWGGADAISHMHKKLRGSERAVVVGGGQEEGEGEVNGGGEGEGRGEEEGGGRRREWATVSLALAVRACT